MFVYSTSSLTGQEASVSIPIAFGKVPVAEVSDSGTVQDARAAYDVARRKERDFL